jgi:hypothetical protein
VSHTFAGGTLRVRTPPSYDATLGTCESTAVLAALEDSGLHLVEQVDLTPRLSEDPLTTRAPARNRAGTVHMELDLPPHHDAVVLLKSSGAYAWRRPVVSAGQGTPGTEVRTVTFEIAVQPRPGGRRLRPVGEENRTQGRKDDVVHGAAQALVLRFTDPAMLDRATEKLDAKFSVRTNPAPFEQPY